MLDAPYQGEQQCFWLEVVTFLVEVKSTLGIARQGNTTAFPFMRLSRIKLLKHSNIKIISIRVHQCLHLPLRDADVDKRLIHDGKICYALAGLFQNFNVRVNQYRDKVFKTSFQNYQTFFEFLSSVWRSSVL